MRLATIGFILSILCLFHFGQDGRPSKGDLNNDTGVDATDAVIMVNYLAGNLTVLLTTGDLFTTDDFVGNLRFVAVGTFTQGTPGTEPCRVDDELQFSHTLTHDLLVMEVEVTRSMWAVLKSVQTSLPTDQSHVAWSSDLRLPVQKVTWYETLLFANLLSFQQGLTRCYYKNAALDEVLDSTNYTSGTFIIRS